LHHLLRLRQLHHDLHMNLEKATQIVDKATEILKADNDAVVRLNNYGRDGMRTAPDGAFVRWEDWRELKAREYALHQRIEQLEERLRQIHTLATQAIEATGDARWWRSSVIGSKLIKIQELSEDRK
jgi:hypothetical protein